MAHPPKLLSRMGWRGGLALAVFPLMLSGAPASAAAAAAAASVPLGAADSFAVLAGSTITNVGPTVINGNLGLHPGTAVVGLPPGTVIGAKHVSDAAAQQAATDLTTPITTRLDGRRLRRRRPTSAGERSPAASTGAGRSPRLG